MREKLKSKVISIKQKLKSWTIHLLKIPMQIIVKEMPWKISNAIFSKDK